MELEFPIEFTVRGTPVSFQAKRAASREQWKSRVKDASRVAVPEQHFASGDRMSVTLYYLAPGPVEGDIDNIVKLVLDALCRHIYLDDAQVERVVVQKFEPGRVFEFGNPSPVLADALGTEGPVLFIRISNDPFEDLR